MKNTVTIVSVFSGETFTNKQGFRTNLMNISTFEPYEHFEFNADGDKVLSRAREVAITRSDFLRLLVLDEDLPFINESEITEREKQLSEGQQFDWRYHRQIKCMKSARLTIEREEVKTIVYSDKVRLDEKGKEVVDPETGEVLFEPLLGEDGQPVTKVIGFGATRFVSLELTPRGRELARKYVDQDD